MRNIYKKTVSLLLAVMLLLSMTAVGVMAESAAPTEVKNCTYSGFDSTLNISFEDSAKAWLNAITDVTANGVTYTKGTVSWGAEGNLWNIGTVSGAYGDEQALKLLYSSGSFPSTIVVKANGYDTVTLNVTSESSGYKATITTAEPTAAPTASPTPEPTPVEDTDPPTNYTVSAYFGYDFNMTFTDAEDWLNAITDVQVSGTSWEKVSYSNLVSNNAKYYVSGSDGRLYIGEGFDGDTAVCVITAEGYKPLTLTLNKTNHSAVIGAVTPTAAPTASPTPAPSKDKEPPTNYTVSAYFGYDFNMTFTDAEDWLNAITDVQVSGTSWEKVSYSNLVSNNAKYYVSGSDGRLYIGEGFDGDTAVCVITAEGYKPLTLTLNKTNHTAVVGTSTPTAPPTTEPSEEPKPVEDKDPPTDYTTGSGSASHDFQLTFNNATDWTQAITGIEINGEAWTESDRSYEVSQNKVFYIGNSGRVLIGEGFEGDTATCIIKATGYKPLTLTLGKTNYSAVLNVAYDKTKSADANDVTLEYRYGDWIIGFKNPADYVGNVLDFKVNGISWAHKSTAISGGAYSTNASANTITIAETSYSTSSPAVKSGDVITISAKGYEDLNLKFVVDKDGKASLVADDGKGDPLELHVKIEGSFEAAIVGQKDYDGVSGASTGGSTSNNNSNVTVYGALVEKDKEPTDDDWQKLDNNSEIDLNGSKCKVSIVPDVESGTPEDADSGMSGVYMPISSDLTLSGTPKDAGKYLVSVSIEDKQGRKATSNTLPFMIYTGEETLAEQIKIENLKQYANGLYAWDIMEPWAIKNFGSNVDGEEESVRVPADLEVWFGSHESGTYGYLGYDLAWDEVEAGNIPQTLYIPAGCNLTLTNMEILSSVRIVVEDGGKLTLDDSVVQGIIDVQGGGTFSMNYSAYSGEFKTGASVCGQIRLADGAILENAAIYSHANYLANGDLADRTTSEPVVVTNGNVAVKGQVFIEGDDAGNEIGQTALQVNGTLTLADGATLVAYGGGGMTYFAGGTAIDLNGTITGNGKLVAIGGAPLFGDGGTAISGSGTISTSETFLQGGTAFTSRDAKPGKALNGDITLTSQSRHVKDGTLEETGTDDPLKALYWNTGIELIPPLDMFTTEQHTDAVTDTTVWKFDENTHWNPCDDATCSVHVNEAAHTFVWVNDEAESDISTRSVEARTKHEECTVCGYTRNENTPITPDPVVTPEPSAKPTAEPTTAPTTEPSVTPAPTTEPTATPAPTTEPTTTPAPTAAPSAAATVTPVPNNNNGSNTPKTGSDYIAVIFSISLLTVSGAAIAALVLLSKKRGKHVAK